MIEVAMAVILNEHREVLIARRPFGKSYGGLWEFPGGKVEKGESPSEAVVRELEEELGIQIKVATWMTTFEHQTDRAEVLRFHPMICEWVAGELLAIEHEATAWVGISSLRHYDFAKPDYPVIEQLETLEASQ